MPDHRSWWVLSHCHSHHVPFSDEACSKKSYTNVIFRLSRRAGGLVQWLRALAALAGLTATQPSQPSVTPAPPLPAVGTHVTHRHRQTLTHKAVIKLKKPFENHVGANKMAQWVTALPSTPDIPGTRVVKGENWPPQAVL